MGTYKTEVVIINKDRWKDIYTTSTRNLTTYEIEYKKTPLIPNWHFKLAFHYDDWEYSIDGDLRQLARGNATKDTGKYRCLFSTDRYDFSFIIKKSNQKKAAIFVFDRVFFDPDSPAAYDIPKPILETEIEITENE